MSYEDGFRSSSFNPPGQPSSQAYRDYEQGWGDGGLLRMMNSINDREAEQAAKEREETNPTPASKLGLAMSAVIYLLIGIGILSQFPLLCIVLCALLVLGLISWLLVKKKGKWVAYGLLVAGLLAGLYVSSLWVERQLTRQAIRAERKQWKEEYAQQVIIMNRADSILRANRAKYPFLQANKQRSQKQAAKPHHSSRLTLAEALGIE